MQLLFCLQSLPSDSQKIRTALAGGLFAYEIPLPSVNCKDESSTPKTRSTEEEKEGKIVTISCSTNSDGQCMENEQIKQDWQMVVANSQASPNNEDTCGSKEEKCSETKTENGSEENESRLRVKEDWFSEGNKGAWKSSSSPIRRISPKPRKQISPKFGGSFNLTGTFKKLSPSSSSMELTEGRFSSNSDPGISLRMDSSPMRNTLSVSGNAGSNSRSCSNSSTPSTGSPSYLGFCFNGFVVGMHRKTVSTVMCNVK